jgi:hypothetical protein
MRTREVVGGSGRGIAAESRPMFGQAMAWTILLLCGAAAPAAELYYLDRDAFNNQYVGPVGPLVLSGEIVPGDYERFLDKIAEDPQRFLNQNKLVLASSDGNAAEAMKIATLVRSLYTEVSVGPLTGRCVGACFLIFAAATERGTDGENLLGVHRPGLAGSEWAALSTAEAALREDSLQTPVRDFLVENEVPGDLVERLFNHLPTDAYYLSEADETTLGSKSPAFQKFLAKNCDWNDSLERAVYKGERPAQDLQKFASCRARVTQPEAKKALAAALKDRSGAPKPPSEPASNPGPVKKPSVKNGKRTMMASVEAAASPFGASLEHHARKVKRHRPVRHVHDLADAKVPAHTAQEISVDGAHAVSPSQ